MSEPFLGELKFISWNFAPKGWMFASGQTLSIQQNTALFAVLGTTYGGDGIRTFGVPNLQGRVPMHVGANGINLGQMGGEPTHTLNVQELAAHTHSLMADSAAPASGGNSDTPAPAGTKVLGTSGGLTGNPSRAFTANMYSTGNGNSTLAQQVIGNTGGSQPHDNMSPYLVINVIIALQGIFPSQN
jgi:microcystin-dependent protein